MKRVQRYRQTSFGTMQLKKVLKKDNLYMCFSVMIRVIFPHLDNATGFL